VNQKGPGPGLPALRELAKRRLQRLTDLSPEELEKEVEGGAAGGISDHLLAWASHQDPRLFAQAGRRGLTAGSRCYTNERPRRWNGGSHEQVTPAHRRRNRAVLRHRA
jgi:hypothetical protein